MSVSKINQNRINQLDSMMNHTFTIEEAAIVLGMSAKEAAKLMSRWVGHGRFVRLKRGLYARVKQEDEQLNDPWVTATKLYQPCYIGGLSAAEYWGLTNQKISNVFIFTTKKPKNHNPAINRVSYCLRTIPEDSMFGLTSMMRGTAEVFISDPARTMVDLLVDPQLGGGINNVIDTLTSYLKSSHKNMELLLDYARRHYNRAIVKRLGYLLERCQSGEFNTIWFCKNMMFYFLQHFFLKIVQNFPLDFTALRREIGRSPYVFVGLITRFARLLVVKFCP